MQNLYSNPSPKLQRTPWYGDACAILIQTLEAKVGTAEHYAHAATMGEEGQGIICNNAYYNNVDPLPLSLKKNISSKTVFLKPILRLPICILETIFQNWTDPSRDTGTLKKGNSDIYLDIKWYNICDIYAPR